MNAASQRRAIVRPWLWWSVFLLGALKGAPLETAFSAAQLAITRLE